jgi:predicted dinucleotide-binding enzyme
MIKRNPSMSTEPREIVVVIGPGSIGQAIARRVGSGGAGIVVASMAGHRESP